MADPELVKITELPEETSLLDDDLFTFVKDSNDTNSAIKKSNMPFGITDTLQDNLDWNSKGFILTSQTYDAGASTGDLCYFDGTDWKQADASAEATSSKKLGILLGSGVVLTVGIWTTTGLTAGANYYVSETAGGITNTQPSTSGSIVRGIGYALSTTELFFIPEGVYIEVA